GGEHRSTPRLNDDRTGGGPRPAGRGSTDGAPAQAAGGEAARLRAAQRGGVPRAVRGGAGGAGCRLSRRELTRGGARAGERSHRREEGPELGSRPTALRRRRSPERRGARLQSARRAG